MPPTHDDVLAATAPHDRLAGLAAIVTTLAPLPVTPLDAPSPVDEHGAATSSLDSNSNQPEVPEPASASVLDGGPGSPARPVTPTDDVAALFAAPPPRGTRKRKRNQLSDDEKVDSVLAAVEGVRAVAVLLCAAVGPASSSTDPLMNKIAECLEYSVDRLESCTAMMEAACDNTSAKNQQSARIENRGRKRGGDRRGSSCWPGVLGPSTAEMPSATRLETQRQHLPASPSSLRPGRRRPPPWRGE